MRYSALPQDGETTRSNSAARRPSSRVILFWGLAIALAAAAGGFSLGIHHQTTTGSLGPVKLSDDVQRDFTYNRTFAEAPSAHSDGAWEELFPTQGGFFTHPTRGSERWGLALFHQLHCLDIIRRGYWAAAESAESETSPESSEGHSNRPHMRHCIDYLRQSLMCHADTNFEPVVENLYGVHGFGVEHQCRDFNGVRYWIAEREVADF
ncbi:MAG: hypothetical protein M1818_008405 [Claussenomyces sp. TS43310]|nr:MAG: hypothetical protein M1818_008405 [Claussenomyces sp. TS43310]